MRGQMKYMRWIRAIGLICLGLLAAWSWLFVVSTWGPAQRVDILTFKAGLTSKVMRALLKPAQQTGHHSHDAVSLSGIYATPEYYTMTEQAEEAATFQPDRFAVFYLLEDIHLGELSDGPVHTMLRSGDGETLSPIDNTVLRTSSHHRVTVVRFPGEDARGQPFITNKTPFFELVAHDPSTHSQQVMRWDLPIVYPKDLKDSDLSLPTLLALLAGLLAMLSPCLLQLTVYYTFALAGVSMEQGAANPRVARARVIRTALAFVAGFTLVFTATGTLAGLAGQKLQSSGLMDRWNRPLSIAAGVGILLLGVLVAIRSDRSGVCRLPFSVPRRPPASWLEMAKAMFMGSAFAVGCSTCFGGALFISLMIYVGATGSAALGAAALFLFSLGIAIPYLIAAVFLSRALPLIGSLQKVQPLRALDEAQPSGRLRRKQPVS